MVDVCAVTDVCVCVDGRVPMSIGSWAQRQNKTTQTHTDGKNQARIKSCSKDSPLNSVCLSAQLGSPPHQQLTTLLWSVLLESTDGRGTLLCIRVCSEAVRIVQ